jgi:hypothetical protein
MRNKIDLKSAGVGLLAGILVTLTIGAASKVTGPVGRFQITGTHSHALVIDTATGQVWRGFFPSGSGNTDGDFLQPKL